MGKEAEKWRPLSPSQIHSHHSCPLTEGTLHITGGLLATFAAGHKMGHVTHYKGQHKWQNTKSKLERAPSYGNAVGEALENHQKHVGVRTGW